MFIDKDLQLSDGQAVTGDANSTNVIDMKAVHDAGIGNPLYMIVQVVDAFTAGAGNVQARAVADDARTSPRALGSVNFTAAEARVVGTRKHILIPPGEATQFLDARFDATTNFAGGAFDVWVSPTIEGTQYIPSGYTVAK